MTDASQDNLSRDALLKMTTQVVSAYVGNNAVPENQIPDVIQSVYGSLEGLGQRHRRGTDQAETCRADQEIDHAGPHYLSRGR